MRILEDGSHRRVLGFLVGMLLLILVVALFLVSQRGSKLQATTTQQPAQLTQFQPFVGQWSAHWGLLTVKANGDARLVARTYQWCGSGIVAPCDALKGNTIVPGIDEQMQFTSVAGSTASGKILSGSGKHIGAVVTLTIGKDDTLMLSDQGVLCGPKASPGLCGA